MSPATLSKKRSVWERGGEVRLENGVELSTYETNNAGPATCNPRLRHRPQMGAREWSSACPIHPPLFPPIVRRPRDDCHSELHFARPRGALPRGTAFRRAGCSTERGSRFSPRATLLHRSNSMSLNESVRMKTH